MVKRKSILRDKSITIRLTQEEYDKISENATALGLSLSDYLRMIGMQKPISIPKSLKP